MDSIFDDVNWQENLDIELEKGIESMKNEKLYTADEVKAEFKNEFGI